LVSHLHQHFTPNMWVSHSNSGYWLFLLLVFQDWSGSCISLFGKFSITKLMKLSRFLHSIVLKISNHKVDAAIKILALHCLFYFQSETWWCFQILAFYCLFWNFPSESWWRRSIRNCACISLQFHSFTYCVFHSDEFDMFSVCIMCGGSDVPSVLLPPKPSYKSGFTWTLHGCHQPHCGNCLCSNWRYLFLNCVAFDIVLCFAICFLGLFVQLLNLNTDAHCWGMTFMFHMRFVPGVGSTTQFQFQTLV
jgi:hypothetical protein